MACYQVNFIDKLKKTFEGFIVRFLEVDVCFCFQKVNMFQRLFCALFCWA